MSAVAQAIAASVTFATPQVQVRPLQLADESLYCEIYADAQTMRFVGTPLTAVSARRSFAAALAKARARDPEEVFAVIVVRASGHAVGICGLRRIALEAGCAETGILLTAAGRGRGYGAEVLRELVTNSFAQLPLDELFVEYAPQNLAMAKVAQRAGFNVRTQSAQTCCAWVGRAVGERQRGAA